MGKDAVMNRPEASLGVSQATDAESESKQASRGRARDAGLKTMGRRLALWAVWMLVAALLAPGVVNAAEVGRITAIEGRADVVRAGAERAVEVKVGAPVSIGDIVRTRLHSKAEITFNDSTVLRLAPETRVRIEEYLFNPDGTRQKGSLYLFRGKVRGVVSKMKRRIIPISYGSSPFEVRTQTAIAGVKGTDMFVFFLKGVSGVVFREGSGFVFNPNLPGEIVSIRAGQATLVAGPDLPPLPPKRVTGVELTRHVADTEVRGGEDAGEDEGEQVEDNGRGGAEDAAMEAFGPEGLEDGLLGRVQFGAFGELAAFKPMSGALSDVIDTERPDIVFLNAPTRAADSSTAVFSVAADEAATYTYELDGVIIASDVTWGDLNLTGLSEGTHTLTVTATDRAGNTAEESYSWFYGSAGYDLNGTISVPGATAGATTGSMSVSSGGQGAWEIDVNGALSGLSDGQFVGYLGGRVYGSTGSFDGFWVNRTGGTAAGVELSGVSNLTYISTTSLGMGYGAVTGAYDAASGSWQLSDAGIGALYTSPLSYVSRVGSIYTPMDAIMGGMSSLWGSKKSSETWVTMIGAYTPSISGPDVWVADGIYSSNYLNSTATTYDNGAYYGFVSGASEDGEMDNRFFALYIDPSGNAGVLRGRLSGEYYSGIDMFASSGGIFSTEIEADAAVTPTATSLSSSVTVDIFSSSAGASVSGSFDVGTVQTGAISSTSTNWTAAKYTISGEDWGIWRMQGGGTYSGLTTQDWDLSYEDASLNSGTLILGTETDGVSWSDGNIEGYFVGYKADGGSGETWVSAGVTSGVFDPQTYAWEAVQSGVWISTDRFISMTQTTAGQTALNDLNIPYAEVGRATLTGSDGNVSMSMTDVVFFAYSSGDAARIWATNNVTGTYTTDPVSGTTVALSGYGLSTNFTVTTWGGGYWASTVSGSGTYSGTGTMNGSAVQMSGGSAGAYGSGAFSGTGAGVVR
jgi:hypothetical protein